MKQFVFSLLGLGFCASALAQATSPTATPAATAAARKARVDSVDFERQFNFFAAAGAAYMFNDQYSVAISPVDNTVQFEKTYPIITRFSLGLVWNPLRDTSASNLDEYFKNKYRLAYSTYKANRKDIAFALLVNVFQLGYSAGEINTNSPIDVGFGIGIRRDNFLLLGTVELTPFRSPRRYFTDQFKDKNKTLVLAGTTEPVRTISIDDNAIFVSKIYPSIGIKIAYAFSQSNPAVRGAKR